MREPSLFKIKRGPKASFCVENVLLLGIGENLIFKIVFLDKSPILCKYVATFVLSIRNPTGGNGYASNRRSDSDLWSDSFGLFTHARRVKV